MDNIDWEILNSLTDDYESFEQIRFWVLKEKQLTDEEIKNRIIRLLNQGFLYIYFDETGLVMEDKKCRNVNKLSWKDTWLGLTQKGVNFWEEKAEEFCDEKVNWDNVYCLRWNYKEQVGFVYGRTEQRCKEVFAELLDSEKDKKIDLASIKITEVTEYKFKYYKTLSGYELSFTYVLIN